jgi:hypothetical protein
MKMSATTPQAQNTLIVPNPKKLEGAKNEYAIKIPRMRGE